MMQKFISKHIDYVYKNMHSECCVAENSNPNRFQTRFRFKRMKILTTTSMYIYAAAAAATTTKMKKKRNKMLKCAMKIIEDESRK